MARNGHLDLSSHNFDKNGIIALDGEWDLYWGQFIEPADFSNVPPPEKTGTIDIPGPWSDNEAGAKQLPRSGHATLRLRISLPPAQFPYALRLTDLHSAYKIWGNGTLLAETGRVGSSKDDETPILSHKVRHVDIHGETLELILQISNYYNLSGGIFSPVQLGTQEAIDAAQMRKWGWIIFFLGGLLLMGVYHIVLYLLRRQDKSPLYMAVYCQLWFVNTLFQPANGGVIFLLAPDTHWELYSRINAVCYFLTLPVLFRFYHALFPAESSRNLLHLYETAAIMFSLIGLFAPFKTANEIAPLYHIFSFFLIGYFFYLLGRAAKRGREGALILLAGFTCLAAGGTNDMLHDMGVIHTAYLTHVALTLLLFSQAFAIALRSARAFAAVEHLSKELGEKNLALSQMDKLKDEFLANTSHELRTPLSGIIGIAESLQRGAVGALPAKAKENLSLIVSSARRLATLVNDILDFSRLKNRDLELRTRTLDLYSLTEAVLAVTRPLAEGKKLQLKNAVPQLLPPVQGDEDRLQQILFNLIGNAIKFTEQGEVTVSARAGNPKVEIFVSDTGIGIPKEKLEDIFVSFEQADASSARRFGGTGLGLPITRKLVELHGGTIEVESTPGAGSTFRFTLPAAAQEATSLAAAPAETMPTEAIVHSVQGEQAHLDLYPRAEPDPKKSQPMVLVVDDEPVNLQVASNHLRLDGIQVATATSGAEAIAAVERHRPDLVLLDIMMPGMTGYQVCRRLRHSHPASKLPILMLTARTRIADLVEGFNCGANDYLTKPIWREELLSRVRSHLKIKQAFDTLAQNLHLKKELEHRRQTEAQLRLTQRRLSEVLDAVEEPLFAVNESQEISFCNRPAQRLLGSESSELLGQRIWRILGEQGKKALGDLFETPQEQAQGMAETRHLPQVELNKPDGNSISVDLLINPLELEDEVLYAILVRRPDPKGKNAEPALEVIEELNRNRRRIQSLEDSLNGMLPQIVQKVPDFQANLRLIDSALDQVGRSLHPESAKVDQRLLCVELMNLTLDYWAQVTATTKAELARQSGLWKVYTNKDGWERTQTLDKYLNLDTLPKTPRRKLIIQTADYVLANCELPSPLREQLETTRTQLNTTK